MKKFLKKYFTGIVLIPVIVLMVIFGALDQKDLPIFMRSKVDIIEDRYHKQRDFYTSAAKFFANSNPEKSALYLDSVHRNERELDSMNIFVIQKNKL